MRHSSTWPTVVPIAADDHAMSNVWSGDVLMSHVTTCAARRTGAATTAVVTIVRTAPVARLGRVRPRAPVEEQEPRRGHQCTKGGATKQRRDERSPEHRRSPDIVLGRRLGFRLMLGLRHDRGFRHRHWRRA